MLLLIILRFMVGTNVYFCVFMAMATSVNAAVCVIKDNYGDGVVVNIKDIAIYGNVVVMIAT